MIKIRTTYGKAKMHRKGICEMKKWKKALLMALPTTLFLGFQAFAGQWNSDMNGWWYQEDDGSYLVGGWYWLDGNKDGTAECYYFDKDGYLVKEHGYVDGYEVDENGAWTVNGKVQTKQVETAVGQTEKNSLENGSGTGMDSGVNSGASQVTDITGINDAAALLRIAAEKNDSLDQVDGTIEMTISQSSYGITVTMSANDNFKAQGIHSGTMQFVSDGTVTVLGTQIPMHEFYTDGYYYSESSSRKYREPMSAADAFNQSFFSDSYIPDPEDAEYAGVITVRQDGGNKILYLDLNSDVFREEMGLYEDGNTTYQIHTANMEIVINPEGYCISQTVNLDVDETEYDADYGISITKNQKLFARVSLRNPGQPVDFAIPPTAGYEEIYMLK